MAEAEFQDRCLKPLGHPSLLIHQRLTKSLLLPKSEIGTGLAPLQSQYVLRDAQCIADGLPPPRSDADHTDII
jgi:hypothetical protein